VDLHIRSSIYLYGLRLLGLYSFVGTGARCLRFHLGKPARDTTFEVVTGDGTQLLSVTNDLGSTYSEYSLTIQSTPSTRVSRYLLLHCTHARHIIGG